MLRLPRRQHTSHVLISQKCERKRRHRSSPACSSTQCTTVVPVVFAGRADDVLAKNVSVTLPTLERGQAIRGHHRPGDQLAIHARPCLALLPAYMGSLSHVHHLRILGALCVSLKQIKQDTGADAYLAARCLYGCTPGCFVADRHACRMTTSSRACAACCSGPSQDPAH